MNVFSQIFTIQNWPKFCLKSFYKKCERIYVKLLSSVLKVRSFYGAFAHFQIHTVIWGSRLVEKKIFVWWWILKKMVSVFSEAHQCVFSDFSPSKIWQNFACFQKKVKGFTFMTNLLTSTLKTGALCVAFARVKTIIWGCRLVKKK